MSIWSSMSSKLVFLPVAIPVVCTFSSTVPMACKLLNRDNYECLTRVQMASADFP